MKTIEEVQKQIIQELQPISAQPAHIVDYIMELGEKLPPIPLEKRTPDHLIDGCLSKAWLTIECKKKHLFIEGHSDALFTKGLIALIIMIFSGQPADAILQSDLFFHKELNLNRIISPQRRSGIEHMCSKIKNKAHQCLQKNKA